MNDCDQVMLLRSLVTNSGYDDKNNLTLEQPLVVTPTLWFLLGNRTHSSELQRRAWLHLENPPIVMAVNQTQTAWYKTWKANRASEFTFVASQILFFFWLKENKTRCLTRP